MPQIDSWQEEVPGNRLERPLDGRGPEGPAAADVLDESLPQPFGLRGDGAVDPVVDGAAEVL